MTTTSAQSAGNWINKIKFTGCCECGERVLGSKRIYMCAGPQRLHEQGDELIVLRCPFGSTGHLPCIVAYKDAHPDTGAYRCPDCRGPD